MTQTIEHNFPVGTELLVENDGKHRVVDPSSLFIHSVMPEGYIATEWFEDEGGEPIDPPEADYVDPDDVKAVLSNAQPQTPVSELQAYNKDLALFAGDHAVELSFEYRKGKNAEVRPRRVQPEAVYATPKGNLVVIGHDPDKDDVRAFRLDRFVGRASV